VQVSLDVVVSAPACARSEHVEALAAAAVVGVHWAEAVAVAVAAVWDAGRRWGHMSPILVMTHPKEHLDAAEAVAAIASAVEFARSFAPVEVVQTLVSSGPVLIVADQRRGLVYDQRLVLVPHLTLVFQFLATKIQGVCHGD